MKHLTILGRSTQPGPSSDWLSPRERECIDLATLSNSDIALALGLSVHTIRANLRTAFLKLGASNRTEARELAYRLEMTKAA